MSKGNIRNLNLLLLLAFLPKGPGAQPLGEEAPLTLARVTGAVGTSKGLCPLVQARRGTPICLATGAAQLPADEALDVLNCGRRQEGSSHSVQSHCA